MFGILDDLFDFNNNGKLDAMEEVAELATIAGIMDSNHDTAQTELQLSGLDADELELMDEDERREAMEDAGLDPDEYDFDN